VYREAQQEVTALGQDASKGLSDLRATIVSRTRGLSLTNVAGPSDTQPAGAPANKDGEPTAKELSHDEAMKESETVLSRLRGEAAKRLKDLQKAEDAADEALLKFGTNLRDFLREAISIAPPSGADGGQAGAVLFESKDAQGKRVIHTSRFDAQLHVIHTNQDSFTRNPSSEEFAAWSGDFDIDKKTADISGDLAKYPELRTTMEKMMPDTISYPDFWKRYYFLRHGIETAEARRRDLLKGLDLLQGCHTSADLLLVNSCVRRGRGRLGRGLGRRGRPRQGRQARPTRVDRVVHHHPPAARVDPAQAQLAAEVQRREVAGR